MWETVRFVAWTRIQDLKGCWRVTRNWLHRHSGLISFLGVVVILATFIFRDVLKDEEKDAVSALETTQRAYDSRLATDQIFKEVRDLYWTVQRQGRSPETEEIIGGDIILTDQMSFLSSRLNRLTTLCAALPKNEATEASDKLKQLGLERDDLSDSIRKFASEPLIRDNPLTEPFHRLYSLSDRILSFEKTLLKQVSAEARKGTRRLKNFTTLSWVLYPGGVFIGVIGQLAGVKSAGGE